MILILVVLYVFQSQICAAADYSMCKVAFDNSEDKGVFDQCTAAFSPQATTYIMSYINYPPYVYEVNGEPRGILVELFNTFLKQACEKGLTEWNKVTWVRRSKSDVTSLQKYCNPKIGEVNCHFSMPAVKDSRIGSSAGAEIASIHSLTGFAFVTPKVDRTLIIMRSLFGTFKNIWPLFILSLSAAFISGFFIWILDRGANDAHFPKSFRKGIYEGFWWSYISMTTVGYGDKTPLAFCARFFAVFWIICGIVLIAVLTSVLSGSIQQGSAVEERFMRGLKIGFLDSMPLPRTVITKEGGIARGFDNVIELEKAMAQGKIYGFVLDPIQLTYYAKQRFYKLDKELWVYEKTYSVDSKTYGVAYWKPIYLTASKFEEEWQSCAHQFYTYNIDEMSTAEENAKLKVSNDLDDDILQSPSAADGITVLDPENASVQDFLLYTGLVILLIILFGISFDLFRQFWNNRYKSNKGYDEKNLDKVSNHLSLEERRIVGIVDQAMRSAADKLNTAEKDIKNDIVEMSRAIRQELAHSRKTNNNFEETNFNNKYPNYPHKPQSIIESVNSGRYLQPYKNYQNQPASIPESYNNRKQLSKSYNNLGYQY